MSAARKKPSPATTPRPVPPGGIPRDAEGWPAQSAKERTLDLFAPHVIAVDPAVAAQIEEQKKADAKERRRLAKEARERTEADDDRKIREFAERTGL